MTTAAKPSAVKKPNLTPWFPSGTKPVRVGVYNTKSRWTSNPNGAYQYWDGKRFCCTDYTPAGAYRDRAWQTMYLNPEWRGLAADPSKAAA